MKMQSQAHQGQLAGGTTILTPRLRRAEVNRHLSLAGHSSRSDLNFVAVLWHNLVLVLLFFGFILQWQSGKVVVVLYEAIVIKIAS